MLQNIQTNRTLLGTNFKNKKSPKYKKEKPPMEQQKSIKKRRNKQGE